MDWDRLHHWHLGIFGAIACYVWALIQVGFQDLPDAFTWTAWGTGFALWAFDDAVFHKYGLKTPFWWIEQGLRLIPLYRKISEWIKKFLK